MPPTNHKELLAYLDDHPCVRFTNFDGKVTIERFTRYENGCLWLMTETGTPHFLPLYCRLTPAAAQSEPGLTFDEDGFTFTKFGRRVRVEYLADLFL